MEPFGHVLITSCFLFLVIREVREWKAYLIAGIGSVILDIFWFIPYLDFLHGIWGMLLFSIGCVVISLVFVKKNIVRAFYSLLFLFGMFSHVFMDFLTHPTGQWHLFFPLEITLFDLLNYPSPIGWWVGSEIALICLFATLVGFLILLKKIHDKQK